VSDTAAAGDAPLVPGVAPLSAFPAEPDDSGHLVPAEEWEQIRRMAGQQAERIRRGLAPAEDNRPDTRLGSRFGTGLALTLAGTVLAPSHGPVPRPAHVRGVPHHGDTAARRLRGQPVPVRGRRAGTSWHYGVDPAETWGVLPDTVVAWHVGNANPRSLGLEQSGRAAMTRRSG
jgi:hypothetical protein